METSSCPVCQGTGFQIRDAGGGQTTAIRCACGVADRGEALRRAARIPRRYDHCTIQSFEIHDPSQQEAQAIATEWIDKWPVLEHGLLFLGEPGTGKTHLAVAIAHELLRLKGAKLIFYEQRELLKEIQNTFDSGGGRSEADVLAPVLESEVLILDDVGAGRPTLWARDVLHDILAHRYNEKLPVIMTSNRAVENTPDGSTQAAAAQQGLTLKDRLGDALLSRVYEMCVIVPFRGKDYRRWIQHAKIRF